MFFRNLTFFRFPTAAGGVMPSSIGAAVDEALDVGAGDGALKPVGPLEMSTRGFVSPYGRDSEVFTQRFGQVAGICIGGEDRILPAAVVNDLLAKKIEEVKEREGLEMVGGRTRKRMREDLLHELLPRAFVTPSRTSAFLDFGRGLICIDHSSRKVSEQVVSQVRHAVGSFPALPLNAEVAPRAVLTGWLGGEPLPEGLSLGSDCELREAGDSGHIVKITNGELQGEELAQHLEAGMQCTRLALNLDDHLSFTLGEDLVVRKLKFLEGAADQLDNVEREDLRAELDARFVLNVGEIQRLFDLLATAFKLSTNEVEEDGLVVDSARAAVRAAVDQRKAGIEAGAPRAASPRARKAAERLEKLAREQGLTMTIEAPGGKVLATFGEDVGAARKLTPGEQLIDKLSEIVDAGADDPLYSGAVEYVRDNENCSISRVQRVFKIGYNRAARLIEAMEAKGVVSPPKHDGTRTILSP
jgi:recombination associated protein RdgC